MNNGKNITIAMLVLSAIVLSTLLVIVTPTPKALAGNTSARFEDTYIMSPGGRADSFDNLYVIDVPRQKLNAYEVDPNRKNMKILDTVDLPRYFQNPSE